MAISSFASLRIGQQISIDGHSYSVVKHSQTLYGRPYCIIEGRSKYRDMLTINGIVRQNMDELDQYSARISYIVADVK